MSNPFSQRFSSSGRDKPGCYGDVDYYDPSDSSCRSCPVKGTCRVLIDRKQKTIERSGRTSSREVTRVSSIPKRRDPVIVEPEEGEPVWSVLGWNAGVNALQAGVDEFGNMVSSIPRKKYTSNMFMRRPKRDKK